MNTFDIESFYNRFMILNRRQRRLFIKQLRSNGLNIRKIEPYTYQEAKGIQHLFFYFDGKEEAVPYFLLDKETLMTIQEELTNFPI